MADDKKESYASEAQLPTYTASADVPTKYLGTTIDQRDMAVLGKKQTLRRQFSFINMLGFASTVMVAWEFCLFVSPFGLQDGGTAGVFWGLLLGPVLMTPVYCSLAEMVSMSPTAGGQYHWVSELAPPGKPQKVLSYATGWLIAIGWQTFLCGAAFATSGLILGLATLNYPEYVAQPWHQTLLTIGIAVWCAVFNVFFTRAFPMVEIVIGALHVLGVLVVIIPLWVTAPIGQAHETIFVFTNSGGWWSDGLASIIGMTPIMGLLIGYDCSVHMSEEVNDASRTLPYVIIWAVYTNAVMLLLVGITYIFCLGDLESILDSATGQPVIQVFFNATQSHAGTSVMCVVVIIILITCCMGEVATGSRQMWSFARDGGFPGSSWLRKVNPRSNIPLNAICVTALITTLLSLINLGSYEALNAFNSLGTVSVLFSYWMTIACLIWRRLFGKPLPPRRWSLGSYGLAINVLALCFITPLMFFFFWPLSYPVTPENMNWSSTMFGGVLIIATIYYIVKGSHDYEGPVMYVKRA